MVEVVESSLLPLLPLSPGAHKANMGGRRGTGASRSAATGWKVFLPAGLLVAASVPSSSAVDCRTVLQHVEGQGPAAPPAHICQRLRQRQPFGLLSWVECRSFLSSWFLPPGAVPDAVALALGAWAGCSSRLRGPPPGLQAPGRPFVPVGEAEELEKARDGAGACS